jgi:peptidoglycan/LPS O-acetylase OafA/YrhL
VQALRGVAALLVVTVHLGNPTGFETRYLGVTDPLTGPLSRIGSFGVDLFFLISGFIMVVSTLRPDRTSLSPVEFLRRRVVRIYPPMWIVEAAVLVVYLRAPDLVNSHSAAKPDLVASFLLLPQIGNPLVLVTWTLVFEMYFYCVFAIALAWRARFLVPILAIWGAAIVVASFALANMDGAYANFFSRPLAFEFLLGAAVGGFARRRIPTGSAIALVAVGVACCSFAAVTVATGSSAFPDGWRRVAFAVPAALIVLGLVAIERERGSFVAPALERLGDTSYAMYLLHVPLLAALGLAVQRTHPEGRAVEVAIVVIAYGCVIVAGSLYYRFVEKPITAFLRRAGRPHRAVVSAE